MVALDERTSAYLPPDPVADWDMLDRYTIKLLDARHDPYDLL
jgi:hypothetical protein